MQQYLKQLLSDIEEATRNFVMPFVQQEVSLHDWQTPEEEDATAPVRIVRGFPQASCPHSITHAFAMTELFILAFHVRI